MRDVARAASEKVGSACETIFRPLSLKLDQFVLDVRKGAEGQNRKPRQCLLLFWTTNG